jgi:dynein heavy chain
MESWKNLDPIKLRGEAEEQQRLVRALGKKLSIPDKHAPFRKLKDAINSFQNSLPLIEQLRNPAIVERHWNRIIEETGKMETVGEINLKSINLQKVLELKLDQYTEIVNNVCVEAVAEENNEKQVADIDKQWKETNFECFTAPKKGDPNERVPRLSSPDDIRQKLEDSIMTLQSVGASKYARSVKGKVAQWEKDLIMISDVIDCWMLAQREWIYLESIFSGDDIKQQLPEQAKKFMRFDANWVTLMNGVDKSRNVRQNCVLADGGTRLSMLQGFLSQFDSLKKSLNSYLEGKKMAFPRFYSLSEEDLLQILGSANPQTITVYLLKLFDACKLLRFENAGKLVTAMVSDEGEEYKFVMPVRPEGNVEDWMGRVDAEMKRTLHYYTKEAIFNYAREDRIDWIRKQLGMVSIIGTQIWWTFAVEDVFKRVKNDKYAMKNELKKESDDIDNLVNLIRTDIPEKLRKAINCLIILDVHQRDIVDMFVRDSKLSADEFDWQKQLRFYWEH